MFPDILRQLSQKRIRELATELQVKRRRNEADADLWKTVADKWVVSAKASCGAHPAGGEPVRKARKRQQAQGAKDEDALPPDIRARKEPDLYTELCFLR